jgi:hypothetical protein
MNIGASGSVMANRYNYYDLDPTYRNAFGQPLMRMTFDYKENEHNNPTGPVGALAYWTADAIKNRYLKNPGSLVRA